MRRFVFLIFVCVFVPLVASAQQFPDIPAGSELEPALAWLVKEGAVQSGKPFASEAPVTRAQAAKMIAASFLEDDYIAAFTNADFPDVPAGSWFTPFVSAGQQSRMWESWVENGMFLPEKGVTQQQMIAAVASAVRMQPSMLSAATSPAATAAISRGDAARLVYASEKARQARAAQALHSAAQAWKSSRELFAPLMKLLGKGFLQF